MNNEQMNDDEIDLLEILQALLRRWFLILLVGLVAGGVGFAYTRFMIVPLYDANAMMLVNSAQQYGDYVSNDQIKSSERLVDTYSIIITSHTVMDRVYEELDMDETMQKQVDSIHVSAVNETQVMKINVVATDPQIALDVCKKITKISPKVIMEVVEAGSVKVVEKATTTGEKISPNIKKMTVIAALFGMLVVCGFITLITLLDNKVKSENDLKQLELPVIGMIPTYEMEGK